MGNLRDELLKKGVINEKRARAVVHEEKARQKRLGADQVEEERRAREEAARLEVEARREADRRREEERRRQHEREAAAENRVPGLIRLGLVREGAVGNRRFYFITRENTVSYVEVSDGAIRSLTDGRIAIVEACGVVRQDFCLVTAEQAAEIAKVDPACVRFVNAAVAGR